MQNNSRGPFRLSQGLGTRGSATEPRKSQSTQIRCLTRNDTCRENGMKLQMRNRTRHTRNGSAHKDMYVPPSSYMLGRSVEHSSAHRRVFIHAHYASVYELRLRTQRAYNCAHVRRAALYHAEPLDFTQNHSASRRARPRFLGPTQMRHTCPSRPMPLTHWPLLSSSIHGCVPLHVRARKGFFTRCTAASTPPDGSRREQLMRRALGCGFWYEDEATRRLCARGRAAAERA